MKFSLTTIFFLLVLTSESFGQADSIKRYLTSALDIMKEKSVNKGKINWDSLYSATFKSAEEVKTIKGTFPIIKKALQSLKDTHSDFYPVEIVKAYTLGYRATGQEFPVIKSKMINGKYAYIKLPDIGSFNNDDWNEYIDTFYAKAIALQKQNPKGWIIDLRGNFGGMLYPMYAAISTFLDHKNVVGMKDAEGKIEYFNYNKGKFYEGAKATQQFQLSQNQPKKTKSKIALLINKTTASSGEFITAAFVGQRNVKLIGEKTQGLTSGNQEYKLADGSFLKLTIGNTVDRNGKEYAKIGEGIAPEIKVEQVDNKEKINEAYLAKAIEYINGK